MRGGGAQAPLVPTRLCHLKRLACRLFTLHPITNVTSIPFRGYNNAQTFPVLFIEIYRVFRTIIKEKSMHYKDFVSNEREIQYNNIMLYIQWYIKTLLVLGALLNEIKVCYQM